MTVHPPKMFYDLLTVWREQHSATPRVANGVFRGITNSMPSYWTVVGVSANALSMMQERQFKGNFALGLRRDHIRSGYEFQQRLASQPFSYDEFCELVADFGRCVVCTKSENPARTAGFGNTYHDADVLWLSEPVDTHAFMAVPTTRVMAEAFQSAKCK